MTEKNIETQGLNVEKLLAAKKLLEEAPVSIPEYIYLTDEFMGIPEGVYRTSDGEKIE